MKKFMTSKFLIKKKSKKKRTKKTTMVGIQVRLVNVETGRYITGSGLGTSEEGGFVKKSWYVFWPIKRIFDTTD